MASPGAAPRSGRPAPVGGSWCTGAPPHTLLGVVRFPVERGSTTRHGSSATDQAGAHSGSAADDRARARETGTDGMSRRFLRQPRTVLALTIAIVGFGVFSSSIGTGALPTDSLPPFGATAGAGSLSTVAELGDVNGDHIGDYAVGLPSGRTPTRASSTSSSARTGAAALHTHGARPRGRLVPHQRARGRDAGLHGGRQRRQRRRPRRHRDRRSHGRRAGQERRRRRLRRLRLAASRPTSRPRRSRAPL